MVVDWRGVATPQPCPRKYEHVRGRQPHNFAKESIPEERRPLPSLFEETQQRGINERQVRRSKKVFQGKFAAWGDR